MSDLTLPPSADRAAAAVAQLPTVGFEVGQFELPGGAGLGVILSVQTAFGVQVYPMSANAAAELGATLVRLATAKDIVLATAMPPEKAHR